ncbi:hypothetical protein R6Q59_002182 [Mikania micrantha]
MDTSCCCLLYQVNDLINGVLPQVKDGGDVLTGRVKVHSNVTVLIWCYYMAKNKTKSEASADLARESLIALSYSLPDTDLLSTDLPKSVQNATKAVNTDEKEKVRSKLISISYAESPDVKGSPVSPKETKG